MNPILVACVAIGGAVGSVSRYLLTLAVQSRLSSTFPTATLLVNVSGSLLLGFITRYTMDSSALSDEARVLLTIGFCGGYTTFSTYSYETAMMLDDGEYGRAALYVGSSVVLALAGTLLGFAAANRLLALRQGA
jgi:CrcB protein